VDLSQVLQSTTADMQYAMPLSAFVGLHSMVAGPISTHKSGCQQLVLHLTGV
jgi:hypothetical protein